MNVWAGKAHTPPRPQRAAQNLPIAALQNFLTTSKHWALLQTERIKKSVHLEGQNIHKLHRINNNVHKQNIDINSVCKVCKIVLP